MLKRFVATALGLTVLLAAPAFAADSEMFKGKTITYIVATGPGGGYDSYGRLIARYLQKHLPGSRVLVRNVPGAGHIVGANTIYAAKADGLTIGMFNTGLIYDQLLKREGVLFDLTKFSWIGKAADDTRALMISKTSPFKNIDDMIGGQGRRSSSPHLAMKSAAYIEARGIHRRRAASQCPDHSRLRCTGR